MQLASEYMDVYHAVNKSSRPDFERMTKEEVDSYVRVNTHCSAIFKATATMSDVFSAHGTPAGERGREREGMKKGGVPNSGLLLFFP